MKLEPLYKKFELFFNPLQRTILWFEKKALENKGLKKVICNSLMIKKEILKKYSTALDKIEVIHNGVEWQNYEKPFLKSFENKNRLLKKLNLPRNCYYLLFIGSGYKRKGLDLLLNALKELKSENFHLLVVGKDKSQNKYKKTTEKMELQEKVTFLGPQKAVTDFYSIADTLVLPTYYDPFANVTLEALAMGLFVITSKFNGGKEVLTKQSGLILKDFCPETLKKALKKHIKEPKVLTKATVIRNSISHLESSIQLKKILQAVK